MSLSYKARRRLALFLLLVWLPLYVVAAVTIMGMIDRLPLLLELAVYILLGVLWAVPFKPVFMGVGKADPDAEEQPSETAE
ncbi:MULTISPECIES: DUF2842 domain-containing protein [Rhodobacterales]|uniref:DUF2842 domain-containing protein n=1 Tax=Halocynthiibacter styelae TaxID=2761955 RepID=A0A8J7LP78_9RHOB|nr:MULTISPECIES: DUF2842 domain-containing protein [Rhodobacterales]MBI1492452.1 DUF2842 domain-containing protein [Paenihalocynthiibacter styelae]